MIKFSGQGVAFVIFFVENRAKLRLIVGFKTDSIFKLLKFKLKIDFYIIKIESIPNIE